MSTMIPIRIARVDGNGECVTDMFQLLQWRAALKIEKAGLRISYKHRVSAHVKRKLGLPMNGKIERVINLVESIIADVKKQMEV